MICDECGKRLAAVHITKVENGKKSNMHLCEQCAMQKNLLSISTSFSVNDLLKIVTMKEDAIYEMNTVLHEKLFGVIPLLRLKGISEVIKIQRRDYYRLKYFKEVNARLVLDMKKGEYGESFKCNIQDISLGGIMLSTAKHLNDKDIIEINLDLDEKIKVVHGVIVRRILKESNKNIYFYGVEYVGLTKADSNNINKFIFKEQRRLIKKGLI
jgi:c-di-GMP-binding flagellar brake protein YcgR